MFGHQTINKSASEWYQAYYSIYNSHNNQPHAGSVVNLIIVRRY